MEIKEVLEEKPWEEFLLRRQHAPFLQSWSWGEFQDKLGNSHHRLGIYEGKELAGVCLAISGHRRLGSYVYVPHGPVFSSFQPGAGEPLAQNKSAGQYRPKRSRSEQCSVTTYERNL